MLQFPLPDGGWSREIHTLSDATVCPAQTKDDGLGVWFDGADYSNAAHWRHNKRITPEVLDRPIKNEVVKGTHLWGGIIFKPFGHFITETLARLWAIERGNYESIVFAPFRKGRLATARYHSEFLNLFIGDSKVRVVETPTAFERLKVPGQGFGLGSISSGTPEFRSFIKRSLEKIPAIGPEKIYVSRVNYPAAGGVIGELFLERNMVAQGFTPIYPERMSIVDQLATFKAARTVVGLDGSAFHMLGYVSQPNQDIHIVRRRSRDDYKYMVSQIAGFSGREPQVIDSITANWMTREFRKPNDNTWGELDEVDLVRKLVDGGCISNINAWSYMSKEDFSHALSHSAALSKGELIRRSFE